MLDELENEDSFDDEELFDEIEIQEDRPVYDEAFMDEDLLEDPFDDSITDEYDEGNLNEEGFHIEKNDFAEETNIYGIEESFDFED